MVAKKGHDLLPPGFRFHPTDEELIMHYLKNQATSQPCPASIIPQVDIYKFDPWQLPDQAVFGEKEWYFFTPRDRKYPNGARPNRAAVSGYWKATGTDKAIYSGSKYVGVKKALVFYKGKPPKGTKTDWIMHEYRLIDRNGNGHGSTPKLLNKSMRLDDWVLCRIYKKKKASFCTERTSLVDDPMIKVEGFSGNIQTGLPYKDNSVNALEIDPAAPATETEEMVFPRVCSISHMLDWELDHCFDILNENNQCCSASSSSVFDSIINNGGGTQWNIEPANHPYFAATSMSLRPPQENSQASELFGFH